MEELFDKLEPLTKVDPLFLYGLVFVCPKNDFEKLIPKILPFYSITFLLKELGKNTISQNQVSKLSSNIVVLI